MQREDRCIWTRYILTSRREKIVRLSVCLSMSVSDQDTGDLSPKYLKCSQAFTLSARMQNFEGFVEHIFFSKKLFKFGYTV